jgi:sulfoxide reductase heme-binding subunit YedZ
MVSAVNRWLLHPAVKPVLFALALAPLLWLLWAAAADRLGANPAEALIRSSGDWALRLLCLTLAVTPLRRWLGWSSLMRQRRMLGLFCFGYALLHFSAYAVLDQGLDLRAIWRDIGKRPFILVGATALALLLPLAATSTDRAMRALGGRRWRALHRLVYAVAALAILHFFWMRSGKRLYGEVAVYAALLGLLMLARLHPPRPPTPASVPKA